MSPVGGVRTALVVEEQPDEDGDYFNITITDSNFTWDDVYFEVTITDSNFVDT